MKKLVTIIALLIIVLLAFNCGGDGTAKAGGKDVSSLVGYKLDGDNITFVWDTAVYGAQNFDPIESITVAGEFNSWSVDAADWQATDSDGDGKWTFKSTTDAVPCGSQFKFVANEVDWQQPPADDIKAAGLDEHITDDGYGGFNLVLVCD